MGIREVFYTSIAATFFFPVPVLAESDHCGNFPHDPACVRARAAGSAEAGAATVTITPDRRNKALSPRGLYRVEFVCKQKGTLPVEVVGAFVRQQVTASLLIAVSDTNSGGAPTPANSKAMLSVYNVGGPSNSRTKYVNEACSNRPFLVAPRQPLYLVAAASNVKTNEVGPALKAIEGVVSIVSSIWPLFTGLPIPTATGARLGAIKDSDTPVATFISAFNAGLSDLKAPALTEGHTVIDADFATIDVHVTALRSIVGVSEQFRTDLEDRLDAMIKPNISGTSEIAAIETACLGAEETLQSKNNLSREDIAYSMVFVGRNAGLLNATQFIHCLGRDYALIAAKSFVENLTGERHFDPDTVATVLPDVPTFPQPEFKRVKTRMSALMGQLRTYTVQEPPVSFEPSELARSGMASEIVINDFRGITQTTSGTVKSAAFLQDLKAKGYTRFGCLMPDNDSLMFFFGLPERPAQPDKGYKNSEVVLMRGWVNRDTKLSRVQISDEGDMVTAVIKYVGGACNGATFADK